MKLVNMFQKCKRIICLIINSSRIIIRKLKNKIKKIRLIKGKISLVLIKLISTKVLRDQKNQDLHKIIFIPIKN